MWRPPEGVVTSMVGACPPCSALSFAHAAVPSADILPASPFLAGFGTSGSIAQNPDAEPVAAPIMASGRIVHHSVIVAWSRVAFLIPPVPLTGLRSGPLSGGTKAPHGCLDAGSHGITAIPAAA
jgi:hypothetical protein